VRGLKEGLGVDSGDGMGMALGAAMRTDDVEPSEERVVKMPFVQNASHTFLILPVSVAPNAFRVRLGTPARGGCTGAVLGGNVAARLFPVSLLCSGDSSR
jgi:hypothetical protein